MIQVHYMPRNDAVGKTKEVTRLFLEEASRFLRHGRQFLEGKRGDAQAQAYEERGTLLDESVTLDGTISTRCNTHGYS